MDSDSSNESDDEFLTISGKSGGNVDREAMIRKKMLESFYGQSANAGTTAGASDSNDGRGGRPGDGPSSAGSGTQSTPSNITNTRHNVAEEQRRGGGDGKDLDSPFFDVDAHTTHHVVNSSVHKLLEMDEQLTLQVRTLDSSTQNMVYENYSKFIDATEAVKSVGVNVEANRQGLERLKNGLVIINDQSRLVEEDLGSLRDAVAEKIRVKRLLTRLDALLKLPETLRDQIKAGRTLNAASNFCRSTNILSKHSAGFESLQKIETECNGIMQDMMKDLNRKIVHWSGQENALATVGSMTEDDEDNKDYSAGGGGFGGTAGDDNDHSDELPPDPPQSISEIFECAGTLALLVEEKPTGLEPPGVTQEDCKMMSLSSSVRFLDRLLDTHQLEVQEAAFSTSTIPSATNVVLVDESPTFEGDPSGRSQQPQKGRHLVPTEVIESILGAATLFCVRFLRGDLLDETGLEHLEEFVKEAYSSFLIHVRAILLEHSLSAQRALDAIGEKNENQEGDGDEVYEDMAGAMSILLHAVRDLASNLSLPEIGLSVDLTADLVEQASELTETLVRRRVEQKFCDLRLRVITECLVPFAKRAAGGVEGSEQGLEIQVVEIAVSNVLQLLDDTQSSIVSSREVMGASAASVDLPILKQSIRASTGRFASWFASTLEVLAGLENPNSIEASADRDPNTDDTPERAGLKQSPIVQKDKDDLSELSFQHDPVGEKVDCAIQDLIEELEGHCNSFSSLDFALKVCEIARNCERSFVDSMNLSMETKVGGCKKARSSGLFPMDDTKKNVVLSDHERKTIERFRLAASRIMSLYATNQAFSAAGEFCLHLKSVASIGKEGCPHSPSDAACGVLEVAKSVCYDCAGLFKDNKGKGGPVPNFSNIAPVSQPLLGMNSSPLKGLQLDVERMFQEKISIFPHPGEIIESSKNAVIAVFFKVVFKAIAEQTRQYSFSPHGFIHLLVDVEFFRSMVFHYIDENFHMDGRSKVCSSLWTLLKDVLNSAGDRCQDEDCVGNENLVRTARSSLREFMKSDHSEMKFLMHD